MGSDYIQVLTFVSVAESGGAAKATLTETVGMTRRRIGEGPTRVTARVFAPLVFLLGVACLFPYRIGTKTNVQMARELAGRRKEYAA